MSNQIPSTDAVAIRYLADAFAPFRGRTLLTAVLVPAAAAPGLAPARVAGRSTATHNSMDTLRFRTGRPPV